MAADVVVFDALADPRLLDHARPDAQLIDAGKRGGDHKLTQDQINQLLLEKARAGGLVVRLKGGDPYLFGRGAEEVVFLAQHGIACEVVPGVTSGIAAPAMAGIPVTHRKIASTVTFVTGHEEPGKGESAVDYDALAKLIASGGTACFYMGVSQLPRIVGALRAGGLPGDMPIAVVQWGASPKQRSVRSTLTAVLADAAALSSPAIIVVGRVAAIREPGLDFYTDPRRKPLFGQRIVVTRTRQQASDLRNRLADLGADVLEAPTIETVAPDDWTEVDHALWHVRDHDWVVFTSTNAVEAVAARMALLHLDARHWAGVKIAVIGDATAESLEAALRIRPDMVPTRFVAESLAGELLQRHGVDGKKFLLLRADIARPDLPRLLMEGGAVVSELTVYQTRIVSALPANVLDALREKSVRWVTFTSSSTARNMVELLGSERDLLKDVGIASIGPITSDALRELGLPPTIEASVSNVAGLVDAIVNH